MHAKYRKGGAIRWIGTTGMDLLCLSGSMHYSITVQFKKKNKKKTGISTTAKKRNNAHLCYV